MPSSRPPPGTLVLVADDDDDLREVVAYALRAEGYLVREAHDGAELIEMIGAGASPNIIVADVKMPRLSGLGVLRALSRVPRDVRGGRMPALSTAVVRATARKLGAVGLLRKPFDTDDLLTAVGNARDVVDARKASAS